ncbi:MAG: GGDEF domain-containing protein [Brevinematales bacterium]|nr:GGDEF domain-containing protein [Brevinematales bacterium]
MYVDGEKIRHKYKTLFKNIDRSVKIINEFSEFLKLLDLREVNILKIMMVRFMIETTNSDAGGLIESVEDSYEFTEIFQYKGNRIIDKDFSSLVRRIQPNTLESKLLDITLKRKIPTISFDQTTKDSSLGKILKIIPCCIIQVPVIVEDNVEYVVELIKKEDNKNSIFSEGDINSLSIISNIASAIFTNAQLFKSAIHDRLTELYNIHYFKNLMVDEMKKVIKFKTKLSLAVMDIDHFKNINDTYGHSVGDEAIKFFANVIRQEIKRNSDIVARYGGDEFIAAFPSTDSQSAYSVCTKVKDRLNSEFFQPDERTKIKLTPSIGIAEITEEDIESAQNENDLFRKIFIKADTALYNSKKTGRNRITIYSNEMPIIQEREL